MVACLQLVPGHLSSKILKEARAQQAEVDGGGAQGPAGTAHLAPGGALAAAMHKQVGTHPSCGICYASLALGSARALPWKTKEEGGLPTRASLQLAQGPRRAGGIGSQRRLLAPGSMMLLKSQEALQPCTYCGRARHLAALHVLHPWLQQGLGR